MRKRYVCWAGVVLLGLLLPAGDAAMVRGSLGIDGLIGPTLGAVSGAVRAPNPAPAGKGDRASLDTDPHLVGWWKLDDVSGKIAADSSKHGHNGTLMDGLSFEKDSVPGRIGKALQLGGRGGYIEITGYKGVTGTRPRTLAAWVKTASPGGEIMSWGVDEPGKMWTFRIVGTGIYVDPKGGYLYTNTKVHDDVWHHVAAVVEEADPPTLQKVKLYKDGELEKLHDIGLLDLYPIDTGSGVDVRIGRGFKGLMDDVRVYDRALSPEEIRNLATVSGGKSD